MAKKESIKAFSFYTSYYEALKDIPKEDAKEILFAITEYVFENKEPKFTGFMKTIWTLIEPNLKKSKNKSNAKSGAPKGNQNACKPLENKGKLETIKKQSKNNQKTIKDIMIKSYSYINILICNINIFNNNNIEYINNLFIEYMYMRKTNKYVITETITKRLINKLNQYGKTDEEKEQIILNAINGGWKDFYELKKTTQNAPEWFDKNIEENIVNCEEQREFLEKLKKARGE